MGMCRAFSSGFLGHTGWGGPARGLEPDPPGGHRVRDGEWHQAGRVVLCRGTSPWCHPTSSHIWGRPSPQTPTPEQIGGPLHFPKEGDAVSDPWWFPGAGAAEKGRRQE